METDKYDEKKLKEYAEKYIYPNAEANMLKGLLLPYLSQEELESIYGKDTAFKIKGLTKNG